MNLSDFIVPVSLDPPEESNRQHVENFGKKISINTPDFPVSNPAEYDVILLGIPEDRNSFNKGASLAPDKIRSQLYQLTPVESKLKILDLGNLKQGNTYKDTYIALKEVLQTLTRNNPVIVLLGGTQELTLTAFKVYQLLKPNINLVTIDRDLDLNKSSKKISANTYLNEILFNNKCLFKYTNIGHQQYLTENSKLELLNKLFHRSFRLGEIRSDLASVEPILRDSEIISFDISSVRQSDAPGFYSPSPNGFYSEEACQIGKYSGLSDSVSLFGIFENNPKYDNRYQTSSLCAQILWYFFDGLSHRNKEFPSGDNKNFKTFFVRHTELNYEITFYKSLKSERWWMEVPNPKTKKSVLISCSYSDYVTASDHEIPDLWWKSYQQLS